MEKISKFQNKVRAFLSWDLIQKTLTVEWCSTVPMLPQEGYQYVRVGSPDSDIFWILLYHARKIDITILFDTGHGNKKHLLNITRLSQHYSEQMCDTMLNLHAFTGCDSVSCFKGIWKIKPLKLLLKWPVYCDILKYLGEDWNLNEDLISGCVKFTWTLYGKAKYQSIDEVLMLKSKCDEIIILQMTSLYFRWRHYISDDGITLQSLKSTTID